MIKPECVVQKFHVGPEWCVVGMTRSLLHHPFTEAEELLAKPKTAEKSNQKEVTKKKVAQKEVPVFFFRVSVTVNKVSHFTHLY